MSVVPAEQEQDPTTALVSAVRSEQFRGEVTLALPEDVKPERFVRATVTALLQNPDIASAERTSVFNAVLRAAQDGLVPDGREAALVLFGGKAQYMPMIAGYRKIAAEHGWTLRTTIVHQNDDFHYEKGLHETLGHVPARPGVERGPMIAAYAVAVHRDGRREFEVMYAEDIERRRQKSKQKDSGPWRDWPDRMWEKTAGRALFQQLPLDPNDKRVASMLADGVDDPVAAVYGQPRTLEHRPVAGELPPATGTPREPGDGGTSAGQQADGGPESADEPVAAPDPDPEPEATREQEPESKRPPVAQARKMVLPDGVNKGMALGDLAGQEGANTIFGWLLRNLDKFDVEVRAAIETVAEKDVPEAWGARPGQGA